MKKAILAQTSSQTFAEHGRYFLFIADGTGQGRQFGGRDGHAEQTDRQNGDNLRVPESSDGSHGQQAGNDGVNECAELNNAAADEYRSEIMDDLPDVLGLQIEERLEVRQEL